MLYPTIDQLTKGEFNRYELAVAVAKCARILTDEYVHEKELVEKMNAAGKDLPDRIVVASVNPRLRDEKAVQVAVEEICDGEYVIKKAPPAEDEYVWAETAAASAAETAETAGTAQAEELA